MKTKTMITNLLMITMFSLLSLTGCAKKDQDSAQLKIEIPPLSSYYSGLSTGGQHSIMMTGVRISGADTTYVPYAPADVSGFDCLLVNVIGSGIGDWDTNSSRVGNGDKFSYIGTFSKLVPVATGGTVEVKVKKGAKRYIQLLGVKSTVGCPSNATKDDLASIAKFPGIFIVGKIQKDVSKDVEVTVNNTYNPATTSDIRGSDSQPVPSNADTTVPTVTTGTLTSGTITSSSIVVNWTAASDGGTLATQLKYKVVRAASGSDISTIVLANAATTVMDWTSGVTTATANSLSASTEYEFVVLVKDYNSNVAIYTQNAFTTSAGGGGGATYTLTYDGNTNDSGSVPVDTTAYASGDEVTVLNNTGSLAKVGYSFGGWNTQANGDGTDYAAGAKFNISTNTTLYAKWIVDASTYNVTYNSNFGALPGSGDAPSDSTDYANGSSVTVLGANTMAVTGYIFNGWNTSADGSGTTYAEGDTFSISSETTLYAMWIRAVHVATTGSDSNTGTTGSPYLTIAHALSTFSANEGGEIRVASGTYSISSSIALKNNIKLKGGYNADFSTRDIASNISKIQPSSSAAFTFVTLASLTGIQLIEGFTFDHGTTTHTGDFIGIDINASPKTTIRYNTFRMRSSTVVTVLKFTGATQSEINGNYINPIDGDVVASIATGIIFNTLSTGSNFKIINNVLDIGIKASGSKIPQSINVASGSGTSTLYLRNNTLHSSSKNGTKTYGFAVSTASGPTLNLYADNNIFFSEEATNSNNQYGIWCATACSVQSMKNNNFFTLDSAFLNGSTSYAYNAFPATAAYSGNFSTEMVTANKFVDTTTGDYRLAITADSSIKTGGLDGASLSWGFTNDADGATRSGSSGTGWSIGAYELDEIP